MSSKQLKQAVLNRGALNRQLNTFKSFIAKVSNSDIGQVHCRLEKIETLWDAFDQVQTEIENLTVDNQDRFDREVEARDAFTDEYFACVAKARELIANASKTSTTQVSNISTNSTESLVKLPALSIPEFNGNYNEYLQFRDTFDSLIHDNNSLSNIQKFYYLKSALKGEAADVLNNLTITDGNYDIALNLLHSRYDNKRVIINSHIKALMEIKQLNKESAPALRELYDNFVKNVRSLENLQQPIQSWSMMLIYIVTSKLDNATKRAWESSIQATQLPTLQQFTDFMNTRCQFLESIQTVEKTQAALTNNKTTRVHVSSTTDNSPTCHYCKGQHYIYACIKFKELSPEKRLEAAKAAQLCTNCLRNNHTTSNCKSISCQKCKKRHNTLLHSDRSDKKEENSSPATVNTHCSNSNYQSTVLLSTAEIYIANDNKDWVKCRALLDSGSQSNFITEKLYQKLNIRSDKIDIPVIGINGTKTSISKIINTNIGSVHNKFTARLSFLVIPHITDKIPTTIIVSKELGIPNKIKLADPHFNVPENVDVLIGASIFFDLLCVGQIKLGRNKPIMQKSKLGWILSGSLTDYANSFKPQVTTLCSFREIDEQLKRFWELEGVSNTRQLTREESFCESHVQKTTERESDGRFVVSLPLRQNYTNLGDTKYTAVKQFTNIENKLQRNPNMKTQYNDFMQEYLELGHMTRVDESEDDNNPNVKYYMPHHDVHKDSLTTSLRVVFNASQKSTSNLSLNDVLCVGPAIQYDLFNILINFRQHKIAFTADISKMYRQVRIREEQRDLQRIIWRNDVTEPLGIYKLNTVTYGTSSASFLATRALQEAVANFRESMPTAANVIISDFYVDDLLTGSDNIFNAKLLKSEITDILQSSGFELRKWISNFPEILEKERNENIEHYCLPEASTSKTLGIAWNSKTDNFEYTIDTSCIPEKTTKRTILSYTANLFDPLGLLAPITIIAKIIIQQLWKDGVEWDETVSEETHTRWKQFTTKLQTQPKISIPRLTVLCPRTSTELHGYCD